MSRAGLLAAKRFGSSLPTFRDQAEAERALLSRRDELLSMLADWSQRSTVFSSDLSAESLKGLERWYFLLVDGPGFRSISTDQETFEQAMAMYLGAVLVRNGTPPFEWFVKEFAFEAGRYEIGVRRDLLAMMLSRQSVSHEHNKRQESLWRMFGRYAEPDRARGKPQRKAER
jgi:hypothetical protein